jgi:predicted RNA-binding Zn ribbon-like protein
MTNLPTVTALPTPEEGHLVVDFINTASVQIDLADPRACQMTEETLLTLADVGRWTASINALPAPLSACLQADQTDGAGQLSDLVAIREALRQIVRARIYAIKAPGEALDLINTRLLPALAATRLQELDDAFVPTHANGAEPSVPAALAHLHWAIGLSAMQLLTDDRELALIRECPGDDCGYLFRDSSRGRRRWCSMRSCGNRAKVKRFRGKHHHEDETAQTA